MTVYPWPDTLPARAISFNPRGMSIAGQPSMTGRTQTGQLDAGYWIATMPLAAFGAGEKVRAFRALRAQLQGGAHDILVPANDEGQAPWPLAGGAEANLNDDEPFDDGFYFDDGTGFFDPSILVTLSAAAALRATAIDVSVATAGTIEGGEYFSIADRLYVISEVLSSTRWAIWPPLREAAASGAELNFDRPICRMKLVSEDAMDLELGRLWLAQPSVAFIESTN